MNDVNNSKMAYEQMQEVIQALDESEARVAIKILVRRYPEIVMEQVKVYVLTMRSKIDGLLAVIGREE